MKEFDKAKLIAKNVGLFLNNQKIKIIDSQNGKDIKLELDKIAEEKIISALTKEFNYPILSEEQGLTKDILLNQPYWIVDPIDGSMNFSRNNPLSCVSIALFNGEDPLLGVIYDFNKNELFSGIVGTGAWLNDRGIKPSIIKNKSHAILASGFPVYLSHDYSTLRNFILQIQEYKKIRMIGSAALSLAYVACGRFDTYIESNIKLWDVAAGVAINKALGNDIYLELLNDFSTNTKVGVF